MEYKTRFHKPVAVHQVQFCPVIQVLPQQCGNRAVAVTQLTEWSLPIPEVRGSNPVIVKALLRTYLLLTIEKTQLKKKEAGNGQLFF